VNVFIDCETIPDQREGALDEYIKEVSENFTAPSTLTKTQAAIDLGITDAKEIKFTSKPDMMAKWEAAFKATKTIEVATNNWLKTSFDGAKGELITVCFNIDNKDFSFSRDYKEAGSEKRMLSDIIDTINKTINSNGGKLQPYFVAHNAVFDLKFLFKRCVILGVNPLFKIPFDGRHGNQYYCTRAAWEGFNGRISQDNLCKALGLPLKPDSIDGSRVWENIEAGNVAEVLSYNRHDVDSVIGIYNKLNFIG
jgi:hypothetical protein